MIDTPTAIMIHVPRSYFQDGGAPVRKEAALRRFYERMGTERQQDATFEHWISIIPRLHKKILWIYVCFHGRVQYRAHLVEFRSKWSQDPQKIWVRVSDGFREHCAPGTCPATFPQERWEMRVIEPHHLCITTGPVISAPKEILQKGFRGFRYCSKLF